MILLFCLYEKGKKLTKKTGEKEDEIWKKNEGKKEGEKKRLKKSETPFLFLLCVGKKETFFISFFGKGEKKLSLNLEEFTLKLQEIC